MVYLCSLSQMMKLKKMKYFYVIIETLQAPGEFSHNSIRARPITGQGLPANMRVECSTSMRKKHPVGTKIKIWAQKKQTGYASHLYTHFSWEYKVLTNKEAEMFIQNIDK
jgi:hypothetical protein